MKKAVLALFLLIFLMGCTDKETGILEVRENMFLTQIDNIYLNYRDYLGRTIKLEGFFMHDSWGDDNWFLVVRGIPDCCGEGAYTGFEVSWDPDYRGIHQNPDISRWPETGEWVEAIGVLGHYNYMGDRLFLALTELNILETRGQDFVYR